MRTGAGYGAQAYQHGSGPERCEAHRATARAVRTVAFDKLCNWGSGQRFEAGCCSDGGLSMMSDPNPPTRVRHRARTLAGQSVNIIPVSDLRSADLHVDAVYQGGRQGNAGDDPFPALLEMSNQGGFRYRGDLNGRLDLVLLTTNMADPDWPDSLDSQTGVFTYYGDNKKPGRALHETGRRGNLLLKRLFDAAHDTAEVRATVPPVLVFSNAGQWRDTVFLGLAVPGASDLGVAEDLVAIWRSAGGRRFQNYRAHFTILDTAVVGRKWLDSIIQGTPCWDSAPLAWKEWITTGKRLPLRSTPSLEWRSRQEQVPGESEGRTLIQTLRDYFQNEPHAFEYCAAAIARLMIPEIITLDVTRPSRDGGRDAVGQMRVGHGAGSILVDFALEAKCYSESNSVGVREMSRLISRLRHRQFGILVTTSWVDSQAYREIKEDRHPIIVVAAQDIVEVLRANGRSTPDEVRSWLTFNFSVARR
jgi:hypothetical protein